MKPNNSVETAARLAATRSGERSNSGGNSTRPITTSRLLTASSTKQAALHSNRRVRLRRKLRTRSQPQTALVTKHNAYTVAASTEKFAADMDYSLNLNACANVCSLPSDSSKIAPITVAGLAA